MGPPTCIACRETSEISLQFSTNFDTTATLKPNPVAHAFLRRSPMLRFGKNVSLWLSHVSPQSVPACVSRRQAEYTPTGAAAEGKNHIKQDVSGEKCGGWHWRCKARNWRFGLASAGEPCRGKFSGLASPEGCSRREERAWTGGARSFLHTLGHALELISVLF